MILNQFNYISIQHEESRFHPAEFPSVEIRMKVQWHQAGTHEFHISSICQQQCHLELSSSFELINIRTPAMIVFPCGYPLFTIQLNQLLTEQDTTLVNITRAGKPFSMNWWAPGLCSSDKLIICCYLVFQRQQYQCCKNHQILINNL